MELKEYIAEKQIVFCSTSSKNKVLGELAGVLSEATGFDNDKMLAAILLREKLMSTGMGQGLGIPHVRLRGLKRAGMAVGLCRQGISDYESLDNEPIYIVVLIAAPEGQHETYIRLLAEVVDVLKRPDLRREIIAAEEPAEIYRILTGGGK